MVLFIQKTKKQFLWFIKEKINPKKFFYYSFGFLTISFLISMIYSILNYEETKKDTLLIASNFKLPKSSELIMNDKNQEKMEKIVNELKEFKVKDENQLLTKKDSLRIDYLYNQYQNLKNGN